MTRAVQWAVAPALVAVMPLAGAELCVVQRESAGAARECRRSRCNAKVQA